MTRDEFGRCLKEHYGPQFPTTWAWISSQDEVTRSAWAKLFERHDARDLTAALHQFAEGSEEVPAYERENTIRHILKATNKQRHARVRREDTKHQVSIADRNLHGASVKEAIAEVMHKTNTAEAYLSHLAAVERDDEDTAREILEQVRRGER